MNVNFWPGPDINAVNTVLIIAQSFTMSGNVVVPLNVRLPSPSDDTGPSKTMGKSIGVLVLSDKGTRMSIELI